MSDTAALDLRHLPDEIDGQDVAIELVSLGRSLESVDQFKVSASQFYHLVESRDRIHGQSISGVKISQVDFSLLGRQVLVQR